VYDFTAPSKQQTTPTPHYTLLARYYPQKAKSERSEEKCRVHLALSGLLTAMRPYWYNFNS